MEEKYGAGRGPIIEIAVIDGWRTRARALDSALGPYKGRSKEDVPGELRDQAYALAREAERLIVQALRHKRGDLCSDTVMLRRNYYHYGTQGVWTGSDRGELYLSYDSRLTLEVAEVIWDLADWDCWSPAFGVKRDMVTWYGAPGIVHDLAHGTVLADLADLPLSVLEASDVR